MDDSAIVNEVKGDVAGSDKDFMETVYKSLTKLLDKAGHNDKCTPALLRQKCATNMGLASTALDKHQFIIHKMIIKWWKASGEKGLEKKSEAVPAGKKDKTDKKAEKADKADKAEKAEKKAAASSISSSSSSSSSSSTAVKKELNPEVEQINSIYKKLRMLAKELDAKAFMEGIGELDSTKSKVKLLLQRFRDAGMPLSDDPTEAEMQKIRDKHTPLVKTNGDTTGKRERVGEGDGGAVAKVAKEGP